MNYMLLPLRRYADFQGRSRRKEFWMFQLFNLIVGGLLYTILLVMMFGAMARAVESGSGYSSEYSSYETSASGFSASAGTSTEADPTAFMSEFGAGGVLLFMLLMLYGLVMLVPSLAVAVRRLHDQDKSGWFLLMSLIPLAGGFILLYFYVVEGSRGPNRFGPDPKGYLGYDRTFA